MQQGAQHTPKRRNTSRAACVGHDGSWASWLVWSGSSKPTAIPAPARFNAGERRSEFREVWADAVAVRSRKCNSGRNNRSKEQIHIRSGFKQIWSSLALLFLSCCCCAICFLAFSSLFLFMCIPVLVSLSCVSCFSF